MQKISWIDSLTRPDHVKATVSYGVLFFVFFSWKKEWKKARELLTFYIGGHERLEFFFPFLFLGGELCLYEGSDGRSGAGTPSAFGGRQQEPFLLRYLTDRQLTRLVVTLNSYLEQPIRKFIMSQGTSLLAFVVICFLIIRKRPHCLNDCYGLSEYSVKWQVS